MEHIKSFKIFEIAYEPSLEEELIRLNDENAKKHITIKDLALGELPYPIYHDILFSGNINTINIYITRQHSDYNYMNLDFYIGRVKGIINDMIKSFEGEYTKYKVYDGGYARDITDAFNKYNKSIIHLPKFLKTNNKLDGLSSLFIIFYN